MVASSGDEELILDVYKVLSSLDGFNIRVLNRMLGWCAV